MLFKALKELFKASVMQRGGGSMHCHIIQVDGDTLNASHHE